MKKVVVVVLLSCFYLNSLAQDWAKLPTEKIEEPLKAGERMPFSELHNMINYPKKTLKFSDHKPKLILLDFWASYCSPCIKSWPGTMKLQKEFGNDLQIILVNNHENVKKIEKILERRKRIDGFYMDMPMSCRDSTLWDAFPTAILPRYIWIGSDGVIGSITGGGEVNRENIKKWLTSGPFKMEQVQQTKMYDVKSNEPLFVNGNGGERSSDVFLYSSTITKAQNDMGPYESIYYDPTIGSGILQTNRPIISLYGQAYNNRLREFDYFDHLPLSRVELIAKDTSKYFWDGTPAGNCFNYHLISSKFKTRQELIKIMRDDLDRYFDLEVKWEKRTKKCLVLSMVDSTLVRKIKSLGPEGKMRDGDFIVDSISVKTLTTMMEQASYYYRMARYPIEDETGYKGKITGIREKVKSYDPATLNEIFMKHGLRFRFEMREVDILVLKERGDSN